MTPNASSRTVLALARIALGWIFLWAFLDKTFGLGFPTPSDRAWINGGSPTSGYLGGVEGPFSGIFNAMSGAAWADWLFMIGQLGLGLSLLLGIGLRVAALTGVPLLLLLWASTLPHENNPFVDEHLIYALLLIGFAYGGAGDHLGLGSVWRRSPIVQRAPILA